MLGLEKEEKNKKFKAKVKLDRSFSGLVIKTLSVITFMIDIRTIKRGETRIEIRLSKCHYMF